MADDRTLKEKVLALVTSYMKENLGSGRNNAILSQRNLDYYNTDHPRADLLVKYEGKTCGISVGDDGKITINAVMDYSQAKVELRVNGSRTEPFFYGGEKPQDLNKISLMLKGLADGIKNNLGYAPGVNIGEVVDNKLADKAEAGKTGEDAVRNTWGEVLGPERARAAVQSLQEMAADREKLGAWYDQLQREGRLGELKSYGIDFDNVSASADGAVARRAEHIERISYELQKMAGEIEKDGPQALADVQGRLAQAQVEARVATGGGARPLAAAGDNNPFAALLGGDYVSPGATSGLHDPVHVNAGGAAAHAGTHGRGLHVRGAGIIVGPAIAAAAVLASGGGIDNALAATGDALVGDAAMAIIEGKGAREIARGAATDVAGYGGNAAGMTVGLFTANAASMGVLSTTALTLGGAVVGGVAVAYAAGKAYDAYDNRQTREGLRERMMQLSNDVGYGLKNQALVELYEVAKAPGKFQKVWDEIKAEGGERYKAVMEYAASTDPDLISQYQGKLKGLIDKDTGDPANQSPEVKSLMEVRSDPNLFAKQWQELINNGADMKDILEQLNTMIAENAEYEREISGDYLPENAATVRANPGMNLPI